MRITNNVLINNLKRNLSLNIRNLEKIQNQLATGKRINRPSDDPVGIVESMRFSSRIKENQQYQENVLDAMGILNSTDQVLGNITDALGRVYELTVYGANGSLNDEDRQTLATEVRQIIEEVKNLANSSYCDKYVFGGTNTTEPPYAEDGWHDNGQRINYEIGKGIVAPVNITAQEVFKEKGLFSTLEDIALHLETGDIEALGGDDINRLKENQEQVLSCRAQVGARANRLELTLNRLQEQEIDLSNLQSEVDGVDPAQLILEMTNQENVYRTSLAVGARVILPTLLEFLR